jgi:hypothetical protein
MSDWINERNIPLDPPVVEVFLRWCPGCEEMHRVNQDPASKTPGMNPGVRFFDSEGPPLVDRPVPDFEGQAEDDEAEEEG